MTFVVIRCHSLSFVINTVFLISPISGGKFEILDFSSRHTIFVCVEIFIYRKNTKTKKNYLLLRISSSGSPPQDLQNKSLVVLLLCYERNTLLDGIYKVRNIFDFRKNKAFSVGLFSITPELLEY